MTSKPRTAEPGCPRYGEATLSDLGEALLASLGAPEVAPTLDVGDARHLCLLVVDGLGWAALQANRSDAPFLASCPDARDLDAGFPSTTVTSLASLMTGLPCGQHGLIGPVMRLRDGTPMNVLRWGAYRHGRWVDLRASVPPERMQPRPTLFERAAAAGVAVLVTGARPFRGSGFSRAVLRGGNWRSCVSWGDAVCAAARHMRTHERSLVYLYLPELDKTGHAGGLGQAWRLQLMFVDRYVRAVAEVLPSDAVLVVTGDHGMVEVDEPGSRDIATSAPLREGVAMVTGEPRARQVHCVEGAAPDVLARWRQMLAGQAWVLPGEQASAAGWFGPRVLPTAARRIGDVVIASSGTTAVFQSDVEPGMAKLRGQHGSLSNQEQLVPLLVWAS